MKKIRLPDGVGVVESGGTSVGHPRSALRFKKTVPIGLDDRRGTVCGAQLRDDCVSIFLDSGRSQLESARYVSISLFARHGGQDFSLPECEASKAVGRSFC